MEKRVVIASLLVFAILLGYSQIINKFSPPPAQKTIESPIHEMSNLKSSIMENQRESIDKLLKIKYLETKNLKISLSNLGGKINGIYFKKYNSTFFPLPEFSLSVSRELPFKFVETSAEKMVLVYENAEQKIIKEFTVKDDNALNVRITILNLGKAANVAENLNLFRIDPELAKQSAEFKKHRSFLELAISLPDKVLRINFDKINEKTKLPSVEQMNWVGFRDRYFCAIVKPDFASEHLFLSSNGNSRFLEISSEKLNHWQGVLYLGPQDASVLVRYNSGLEKVIHLGAFNAISKIVLKIMSFLFGLTKNWGVAVILLGIIIFFVMYPLTAKSLKSMREMQKLQPQIELLKKSYANDPQKLNKEMLELYRTNKVNPFGGCLPLLLQIPIFFALYQALIRSLALKGSSFLWIADLSEPDKLMILPFNIPILGNELNGLPLILTAVMFLQQKMSLKFSAGGDPQQQKLMLVVFPLLFGFMFYHFPSGLALYWVVYSSLSTGFQWFLAQKTTH